MEKPDLIETIQQEGTTLKRKGQSYWAQCPLHNENNASFKVDPSKQQFYCFGCGEGGDVIHFVQKLHGLSFADALSYLNIRRGASPISDPISTRRRQLVREFRHWQNKYSRQLSHESILLNQIKTAAQKKPGIEEYLGWHVARLLGQLSIVEYHLDILLSGSDEAIFELYRMAKENR